MRAAHPEASVELVCGDSAVTLAAYAVRDDGARDGDGASAALPSPFDFVHVDGAHDYGGALADLRHARRLARRGAMVVVDDCEWTEGALEGDHVTLAWAHAIHEGLVAPLPPWACWNQGSCAGRFL